jgi:SAM-dependent methyltransferase
MTEMLNTYFRVARETPHFRRGFRAYVERLFADVPLQNSRLLDIGGGTGLFSFYAAARGAAEAVCLEPGTAGSNPSMEQTFDRLRRALPKANVRLERTLFQQLDPTMARYDVILIHNAINHLDEAACAQIHVLESAREAYRLMFRNLARLAAPGAYLIVADASRHSAFSLLRLKNPFAPTIDWSIHQNPHMWADILEQCGFSSRKVRWNSVRQLGRLGQKILGNRVGAFLTNAHFTLTMRRVR